MATQEFIRQVEEIDPYSVLPARLQTPRTVDRGPRFNLVTTNEQGRPIEVIAE